MSKHLKMCIRDRLGIAYTDAKMGALSMNAGVFHFDSSKADNTIALNIRYPQGTDPKTIQAGLEKVTGVVSVSLSRCV